MALEDILPRLDSKTKVSISWCGVHHCKDCEIGRTVVTLHCVSEFMRNRGREQKWEEKQTCWVQSPLLNLMT